MINQAFNDIYVIIPAYNEEPRIAKVIKQVSAFTNQIIVVDDGSHDQTSQVASVKSIFVLKHKINLGKGAAMKTGAEAAFRLGARSIIFIDADGQHNPKYLPEFAQKLNTGSQIVFGSRSLSYGVPLVRYLGNKFGALVINLFFGIYRNDLLCGFLGMTQKTYTQIKWDSTRYGVETEIVARTGKNKIQFSEVAIDTIYLDKYKGVSILDAIGILFNIPHWLVS